MAKKEYCLVGVDSNIYSIIGYTTRAMREVGFSQDDVEEFKTKVTKQDCYDKALGLCVFKVNECNECLSKPKEIKDISDALLTRDEKELDDYFSALCDKFVPSEGKAYTVGGEIVRAISRIVYRWYNDGDYAGYGYGIDTVGSACTYLYAEFPEFEESIECLINIVDSEDKYNKALLALQNVVANYLDSHPELFGKKNNNDCVEDYSECIYEDEIDDREHYYDDYDEEEEDDDEWEDDYDDEEEYCC